jgi:hypothetical protein
VRAKAADQASIIALFAWLISHQPTVLFSQNKSATSNQPAVFFSQNKSAPATSNQRGVSSLSINRSHSTRHCTTTSIPTNAKKRSRSTITKNKNKIK